MSTHRRKHQQCAKHSRVVSLLHINAGNAVEHEVDCTLDETWVPAACLHVQHVTRRQKVQAGKHVAVVVEEALQGATDVDKVLCKQSETGVELKRLSSKQQVLCMRALQSRSKLHKENTRVILLHTHTHKHTHTQAHTRAR